MKYGGQAGRTKATRGLAAKYGRLPAIERLGNGCCQQPEYGAGIYTANYQTVSESYAPALLRTRDSVRIARCRDAGYRVLTRPEISMLRYANAGGSTGNGVEPQDAMLGKRNAADLGLRLNQHLFLFLPSVSNSVNPTAAWENAGKLLVEEFNGSGRAAAVIFGERQERPSHARGFVARCRHTCFGGR